MLASFDFISPPELIAVSTAFLGGEIFLDPASSERANTVVQATRFFNWQQNGLNQTWAAKNVYLYPPRDIALKSEQPKSTRLFEKTNYFKKSNQRIWLEEAHKKWLKREFDEGIVFITSTEVALIATQKSNIDLPVCILKDHPRLVRDDDEMSQAKNSKVFGFVFYLPSINNYEHRIHDFRQLYSDLGRVYL
ncbi:MAG: hypothetical protein DWQ49_11840 [Bacteroidetes bacterium]|nr:MAG: hypothetical protein DWQ49_11840 [Bacteroidota bacterium]